MDKNTGIFQFDNSGWPKEGDALSEVFIKFPFNFDFTEWCLERLRTGHASTSLGFKWLYISDDKIYIHRGGRCFYQIEIHPGKLVHTAIHYVYGDVDEYMDGHHIKPMETLMMILHKWTDDLRSTTLRTVRSVAYAADAIKLFDKANDTADAIKIVSNSQELSEGIIKLSKYGDAFDVKKETKTITELFSTLQMEKHHVISPKNQKYLEAFQHYTTKYNIDLNGSDNIVEMLHRGRHPDAYHEFILRNMDDFDIIASEMNDPAVFQKLYKILTQQVQDNPIMLKKIFYH